jgi:hypothetical protein
MARAPRRAASTTMRAVAAAKVDQAIARADRRQVQHARHHCRGALPIGCVAVLGSAGEGAAGGAYPVLIHGARSPTARAARQYGNAGSRLPTDPAPSPTRPRYRNGNQIGAWQEH